MYILVINAGSSSLKYQLFNIETKAVLAKGLAERIGIPGGRIKHQFAKNGNSGEKLVEQHLPGHSEAFKIISALLTDSEIGVIEKPEDITAVGHRVVHGGERRPHDEDRDKSFDTAGTLTQSAKPCWH